MYHLKLNNLLSGLEFQLAKSMAANSIDFYLSSTYFSKSEFKFEFFNLIFEIKFGKNVKFLELEIIKSSLDIKFFEFEIMLTKILNLFFDVIAFFFLNMLLF